MEWVECEGEKYPILQAQGNMSQYASAYAKKFCHGVGLDIGYGKVDWLFNDSIGIDSIDSSQYNANNLPPYLVDYIYSSHCLEHLDDWVASLEYWISRIKTDGIIFLYLPHRSQVYWRPWNNRKHKHMFDQEMIEGCLTKFGITNILKSGVDLAGSFMVVGEKE